MLSSIGGSDDSWLLSPKFSPPNEGNSKIVSSFASLLSSRGGLDNGWESSRKYSSLGVRTPILPFFGLSPKLIKKDISIASTADNDSKAPLSSSCAIFAPADESSRSISFWGSSLPPPMVVVTGDDSVSSLASSSVTMLDPASVPSIFLFGSTISMVVPAVGSVRVSISSVLATTLDPTAEESMATSIFLFASTIPMVVPAVGSMLVSFSSLLVTTLDPDTE